MKVYVPKSGIHDVLELDVVACEIQVNKKVRLQPLSTFDR